MDKGAVLDLDLTFDMGNNNAKGCTIGGVVDNTTVLFSLDKEKIGKQGTLTALNHNNSTAITVHSTQLSVHVSGKDASNSALVIVVAAMAVVLVLLVAVVVLLLVLYIKRGRAGYDHLRN
eukprot:TRINITY_DN4790_c0_g1_i1.p3 TRINITY_DN4790_c0_g1~~TRINITY_DN4790_c0_g1_i1.p3  ORF type:complete len:120 (-),score=36.56 TRINITY_DN4790_c0_g1_i1:60-419(-)